VPNRNPSSARTNFQDSVRMMNETKKGRMIRNRRPFFHRPPRKAIV
jgi:hypothetical protein